MKHISKKTECCITLIPVITLAGLICSGMPGCISRRVFTLAESDRALHTASFDTVVAVVQNTHWDSTLGGLDWGAAAEKMRPRMRKVKTLSEARKVMEGLLSLLNQSHFYLLYADNYDTGKKQARDFSPGLDIRLVRGQAVVTEVWNGYPAELAGVQPGWILAEINGEDVGALLNPVLSRYAASTHLGVEAAEKILTRLLGMENTQVTVDFVDARGSRVQKTLERKEPRGVIAANPGDVPDRHVFFESRLINEEIGYIRFNLFRSPGYLMGQFNEAMFSFLKTRGVVLDLRGNRGGLGPMACWMASWFINSPGKSLGKRVERYQSTDYVVFPRQLIFSGPLAVLIDDCSCSTAEILAGGLKDLGLARLFGSNSAGASQPAEIKRLPNGDRFVHALARHLDARGEAVEGKGVPPDVTVPLTMSNLIAGKDAVLEAAIQWISDQSR